MLKFQYQLYERKFRSPLRTHHGLWETRSGILVRLQSLEDPAQVGYGEIAPIPWFGTETLEAAIAFCKALSQDLSSRNLANISPSSSNPNAQLSTFAPDSDLMAQSPGPATRFGLGSAAMQLANTLSPDCSAPPPQPICQLLASGEAAQLCRDKKASTFKWKIGVGDPETERARLRQLCQVLPPAACLRLDANGGLSLEEAKIWLDLCDELQEEFESTEHKSTDFKSIDVKSAASKPHPLKIEFLEQPLPPRQFKAMQHLARQYRTPLALDESVANLSQLKDCHAQGWPGIFVIKGAIAGHPQALLDFCQSANLGPDLVFSSVFETAMARHTVWAMAQTVAGSSRALGFGVEHWLEADGLGQGCAEQVWAMAETANS